MTMEPWNLRVDDSRKEDTVATFIIFCEDENDEPFYFRSFANRSVKVNTVPNQKQGKLNFLNTISKCVQDGKMEFTQNGYRVREDVTENIWSVYDRDMEHTDPSQLNYKDELDFTTAITNAIATGIKVAWSNDVFELWVLLHFEKIPTGRRLHRDYVYQRLTEIFKNQPDKSAELQDLTSRTNFSYESYFKKRDRFLVHVLPLLTEERRKTALENALELESFHSITTPYHERNPCTMVHHLVKELTAFQ